MLKTISYNDKDYAFMRSASVNAFPCSARRSFSQSAGADEIIIPFDPEARLNTEANNRRHTSLNGFSTSYIKDFIDNSALDTDSHLVFVINGYYFDISLLEGYKTIAEFGTAIAGQINATTKIFANISLSETTLIQGNANTEEYSTDILCSIPAGYHGSTAYLDIYSGSGSQSDKGNYYFSGLAFSKESLEETSAVTKSYSLCILEKVGGVWQLCNKSKLPNIRAGEEDGEVIMDTLVVDQVLINKTAKKPAISLDVKTVAGRPRLYFTGATLEK